MNEWVPLIARVVVGVVLLVAGMMKIRSQRWSILALEMGTPRAVIVALPTVELFVGLALVTQVAQPYAAGAATALFFLFALVVTRQYLSGSELPCNCFGADGGKAVRLTTIARNLALLVLAVIGTVG